MSKAYLVLGAESTGTRLVTRLLIECGCIGDGGHEQRWDKQLPHSDNQPLIVIRRSFPHLKQWQNLYDLLQKLRKNDYDQLIAVVLTRDWNSVIQSQLNYGHTKSKEDSATNIRRAYYWIIKQLYEFNIQYYIQTYEALKDESILRNFIKEIGLELPENHEQITDQNRKYYQ